MVNGLTQQLILKGVDIAGRKYLQNGNTPSESEVTRKTIKELEDLKNDFKDTKKNIQNIEEIKKEEIKNSRQNSKNEGNTDEEPYSKYAPEMDIATGCIPCSRAHILGIKGALKEALRFAREDGINHPEVITRVDHATEELLNMERLDLSEEKIQNSPIEQREMVDDIEIDLRELRQFLVNKMDSVDELKQAIIHADNIYQRIRNISFKGKEVS